MEPGASAVRQERLGAAPADSRLRLQVPHHRWHRVSAQSGGRYSHDGLPAPARGLALKCRGVEMLMVVMAVAMSAIWTWALLWTLPVKTATADCELQCRMDALRMGEKVFAQFSLTD